ncbi:hypothetical protein TPHA_0G01540 [Tetrapisispora phaffii CBS 4417]|uniref:Uncharacterized protein n=1 Tax=Tetrapisispora phaffii (strain ATCC 24235 / CBS 4417 / NBRC 1672 / NRRL Y-8282 / UCD 70-5) TaxID=1071381 RepID=G8BVR2_TETPH|nr:hypothetical protein TPHA_0G01540 [Tetrapisispora phaffii CBS 4417]CCE63990.1 hypothetical protein TPHA_0G01540 [Tetrapisispora phaffii CBS 4417]
MDYESILFGLQPIINANPVSSIPLQDVYLESYLTVLDQLAVSLRAPNNRNIVGQTGLLSNLLRVLENILDICFHNDNIYNKISWFKLSSELIRSVANSLIDNDSNRNILIHDDISKKNLLLDYFISRLLNINELPGDNVDGSILSTLQLRSIVLIRNLCIDNEQYTKKFSSNLRGKLLSFLKMREHVFLEEIDSVVMAAELFNDFIQSDTDSIPIHPTDLLFMSTFIKRASKEIENKDSKEDDDEVMELNKDQHNNEELEDESDPCIEITMNLCISFETIVSSESFFELKIPKENKDIILNIQKNLFDILDVLYEKIFPNKLIVMRRLSASIGHISANKSHDNKHEQPDALKILLHSEQTYQISAAAIILSNSINSRDDANELLKSVQIEKLFLISRKLNDPIQFQGILELVKKLLNINNSILLTVEDLIPLVNTLQFCQDQTSYFANLGNQINNLLSKLLVVLPSSTVTKLVTTEDTSKFLDIVIATGGLVPCLLLDKLLVSRTTIDTDILEDLFKAAFKYDEMNNNIQGNGQTSSVTLPQLFQLTKTIGIYLKNIDASNISSNILFTQLPDQLASILKVLLTLKHNTDDISKSVFNNGVFISGIIINLLKKEEVLTQEESELNTYAHQFF